MAGSPANEHDLAFVNAPSEEVVEQLVAEIRDFRPQVVLTFEPGGLYGHPDHIAVCKHTTQAFELAADPGSFPQQLAKSLQPHAPDRLYYSARPRGFRTEWALALRGAGIDFPMPSPEQEEQGNLPEELHLRLDVGEQLEAKMACILCHRTQVAPDWPYHRVPREVSARVLGREFYIRAVPPVKPGETVGEDLFKGLGIGP
jgi:LmbE family N-acetylglucosaminyl deacetylase